MLPGHISQAQVPVGEGNLGQTFLGVSRGFEDAWEEAPCAGGGCWDGDVCA